MPTEGKISPTPPHTIRIFLVNTELELTAAAPDHLAWTRRKPEEAHGCKKLRNPDKGPNTPGDSSAGAFGFRPRRHCAATSEARGRPRKPTEAKNGLTAILSEHYMGFVVTTWGFRTRPLTWTLVRLGMTSRRLRKPTEAHGSSRKLTGLKISQSSLESEYPSIY